MPAPPEGEPALNPPGDIGSGISVFGAMGSGIETGGGTGMDAGGGTGTDGALGAGGGLLGLALSFASLLSGRGCEVVDAGGGVILSGFSSVF